VQDSGWAWLAGLLPDPADRLQDSWWAFKNSANAVSLDFCYVMCAVIDSADTLRVVVLFFIWL